MSDDGVTRDALRNALRNAAEVERLQEEVRGYAASLLAHHNMANLSDEAIRGSAGIPCQICAQAQAERRERDVDA